MRILNGRTLGNYIGKFTYIGHNGVSVVDYVLASEAFLLKNYINSFTVDDLTTLSDHRPLQLQLKNTTIKKQETYKPTILSPKPINFKIKNYETYSTKLAEEMNREAISILISSIEKCNNNDDLKDIIQTTTNLYTNVANKINLITKPKFKYREKPKQYRKRDKKRK